MCTPMRRSLFRWGSDSHRGGGSLDRYGCRPLDTADTKGEAPDEARTETWYSISRRSPSVMIKHAREGMHAVNLCSKLRRTRKEMGEISPRRSSECRDTI